MSCMLAVSLQMKGLGTGKHLMVVGLLAVVVGFGVVRLGERTFKSGRAATRR